MQWHEQCGLHDDFTDAVRAASYKLETTARETADKVVEALRLYRPGRVAVRGVLTRRSEGSLQGGPIAAARPRGATMTLDNRQARAFSALWPRYLKASQHKALGSALRRFAYAGERSRSDDPIVDLVAALEGLLLSDNPRAGEFQFRTSVRGAQFGRHKGYTRRQVYEQLRRAYAVRSQVAHGKLPSRKDLRGPNDEPLDLDAFVTEIEALTRETLKRAIKRVADGQGWPPDWNRPLFEHIASA